MPGQSLFDLLGIFDNFDEPIPSWNKTSTLIPTIITFMVLTWLCVIFRLYTRLRVIYSPGWDDVFVVITLLLGTGGSTCVCIAAYHGFGQHFLLLTAAQMTMYLKLFYVANATYSMSTCLVKLALLLQYLRIYKEGVLRTTCLVVTAITALWGIAYTFMAFFPCFPLTAYWSLAETSSALCYGYGATTSDAFYGTYSSASAINMILDVVILAIPVPLYFREGTPTRAKMGLLGLLFMGGLVNFLSIWRVATIVDHKATTYPTFDPTWYGPISVLLASLEVDVATICASVPVFWPVLSSKLDKIFVTQEIKIERAHRFSTIDDEYELQRTSGDGEFGSHSRGTSESSLHRLDSKSVQITTKSAHYKDRYIMAQVDPLGDRGGRVESEITSQPLSKKQSKAGL